STRDWSSDVCSSDLSDRVVHEIELRHFAEVPDREHRREHRLKSGILALAWQKIHLQKALVRLFLHFNQVGNLDRALDLRKIQTLAFPDVLITVLHACYTPFC